MRVFLVVSFTVASLISAHAQEKTRKPETSCSYALSSGETYEVRAGEALCWRVPPPSYKLYTLLHCDAPFFNELVRVKRGDSRCNKYEERQ